MAMTEEQRKAAAERMKAYHAKKREEKEELKKAVPDKEPEEEVIQPPVQGETISNFDDVEELKRQISELKDMQWKLMAQQMGGQQGSGAVITASGMTGTVDRYDMNFELYPDPAERLKKEPKLQRFAFPMNYELDFTVSETAYTTIDNVRMREPKFQLELVRMMLDEDTGEDTGGRYAVARLTLHEDPDTALILAKQYGVEVQENEEIAFLNEMRYIRMRDWLLDCFYPPKPHEKTQRKQTVIGGRLVEYWEKDTEKGTGITKDQWDNTPKIKRF